MRPLLAVAIIWGLMAAAAAAQTYSPQRPLPRTTSMPALRALATEREGEERFKLGIDAEARGDWASAVAEFLPGDMVEIFRASEYAGGVVDEALRLAPLPPVIWMQLGVFDAAAAERARAAGVEVVMNRCPKIEWGRLSGEIGWHGVNSRIISARKPLAGKGFQRLDISPARAGAPSAKINRT